MTDSTATGTNAPESLDTFLGTKEPPAWRKYFKWGAITIGVILLILLLLRLFGGEEKVNYTTREVRRGDLIVQVSATGNLKPINQVDVGSEQSGLITNVYVDVNDRVSKGQVLATLDTSRLQDTVNQNRASLAAAQANVAQAQATVAQSQANLARLEEVFRLSGGKVPSRVELDSGRADYQRGIASLRAAQAQVQVSRAQLSSAETNLNKARIYSPVTGVVLSRDIEPGQTVAASLNAPVLFTIAESLSQMELEVSVDEADVGQVQDGQSATFAVDAFPGRQFPARITRVNLGSNAPATTGTTSTGTVVAYTAVLAVENPQETLRPGMTATADITTKSISNVLLVPNTALRFKPTDPSRAGQGGGITSTLIPRGRGGRGGGRGGAQEVKFGPGSKQTVHVVGEDGTPQPIEVVVGESDGAMTQITSGDIKEGTRVITGQLAPGQEPRPEREGGERQREGGAANRTPGNTSSAAPAAPAAVPSAPVAGGRPAANAEPAGTPSANAPAVGPNTGATRTDTAAPATALPDMRRLRDMSPEERRAFMDSLTPEQRAEMRARREARRAEREASGAAPSRGVSDGE